MEVMPASIRDWLEVLARIRIGVVKVAGKNITGARIKAVAIRLASFADPDGTRVRPGLVRIALDLEVEYRTVQQSVAWLRGAGLLLLVRAGKGVNADEYRLALPTDLLERDDFEVWSPSRQQMEIGRAREARRGRFRTPPGGPDGSGTRGPQDRASDRDTRGPQDRAANQETRGPQDARNGHKEPSSARSSGTPKVSTARSSGTDMQGPQDLATFQGPIHKSDLPPDVEEVSATVTVSRATGPATDPDSPALPKRCGHGLPGGRRADGKPACALCRVAEARSGTRPPPPDGKHLAPVIPLDPRRTA